MLPYIAQRLLTSIPVLFVVSLLVFSMIHLLPGDPVEVMFRGANATPAQIEAVRHQLGLDQPVPLQFVSFITRALHGDLGTSLRSNRPVLEEISKQLPSTIELAFTGLTLAVILGVALGTIAGLNRNSWIDTLAMAIGQIGVCMPEFLTALLLISFVSLRLRWLPATGEGGVAPLILPAVTLALGFSAITARLTRTSLIDVYQQDYMVTGRAKGLSNRLLLVRHALKNAFIPVVTIIGLQLGNLLGGTVIVETVFARQGVGRLAVDAILAKDFPVIQGTVLLAALVYVVVNLLTDAAYAILDPRIRYQ
ncbi:MAG: ABC transporter permease [Chloroflexi bacterium]|nr:ABC transporter permease [Chloroflexota bacterium]